MQALWYRAAQARSSCRCSSCIQTATTVAARRTTTAIGRRRVGLGDIFTACYSTILATAALADSKVKEDRRKEWDRLIAEAKAGHGAFTQPTGSENAQNVPPENLDTNISSEVHVPYLPMLQTKKNWTLPSPPSPSSLDAKLRTLDARLRISSVETSAGSENVEGSRNNLEHEWQDGPDQEMQPRDPRTRKHLEKMEDTTSRLVNRIIQEFQIFSEADQAAASAGRDIQLQMRDMAEQIRTLRKSFASYPQYYWDSDKTVAEQRSAVHCTLNSVFMSARPDQSNINLILAKICYSLLISSAPPSIETYNLLLYQLSRLKQHKIAQVVVESFFNETKMKPTKRTIQLIVDHYAASNDQGGLRNMIQKMRGTAGDMLIRKRSLFFSFLPSVRKWALNSKVIHRSGYLVEKAPRDQAIFNSLVSGCLKVDLFKDAVRFTVASFRERQQVSAEVLSNVLQTCSARADLSAGFSLLRGIIAALLNDWDSIVYSKRVRYFLHKLMIKCGLYDGIKLSQHLPRTLSREMLETLLRRMRIESLMESVDHSAQTIQTVATQLIRGRVEQGRTQRAVLTLTSFLEQETRKIERRNNNQKSLLTRMSAVELWLRKNADRTSAIEWEVFSLLYRRSSPDVQTAYNREIASWKEYWDTTRISQRLALLKRLRHSFKISLLTRFRHHTWLVQNIERDILADGFQDSPDAVNTVSASNGQPTGQGCSHRNKASRKLELLGRLRRRRLAGHEFTDFPNLSVTKVATRRPPTEWQSIKRIKAVKAKTTKVKPIEPENQATSKIREQPKATRPLQIPRTVLPANFGGKWDSSKSAQRNSVHPRLPVIPVRNSQQVISGHFGA